MNCEKALLRCALVIALAVMLSFPTMAQEVKSEPIVAALNESPPLAFSGEKGLAMGGFVRYGEALFAKAGIPWTVGTYPATRVFKSLADGQANFTFLVRVPSLEECCLFSQAPIMAQEPRVYYIGNKAAVKTKEELAGKSLIIINGYSYAGLIRFINDEKNKIATEVAESFEAAFKMLEAGRADYLLAYEVNAREVLEARPIPALSSHAIGHFPVYMILRKSYPDAQKTMNRLEEIAKTLNF